MPTLRHEYWLRQHGLGDRHGHQHGGGHDPGGDFSRFGRLYAGWETRLCRELCNSGNVSVIDTATNTVVATVTVGASPQGWPSPRMGNTPMSRMVSPGTVSVIDTASNTVVATVTAGYDPAGVAITPDGKHAYVANGYGSNTVSVIDTANNTVVATITVGT